MQFGAFVSHQVNAAFKLMTFISENHRGETRKSSFTANSSKTSMDGWVFKGQYPFQLTSNALSLETSRSLRFLMRLFLALSS